MSDPTDRGAAGDPDEGFPVDATEAAIEDAFATVEEARLVDGIDDELADMVDGVKPPATPAEIERDEYRDTLQRVKAEFDNYRKRTAKEAGETRERAAAALVAQLLPVLDACDAAVLHDATDVGPISKMLLETLAKEGLEPMIPEGQPFDPELHEAVMHEPGDGGESVVIESLRTGYLWKGRVLRPAMVKVRG
ncbi:MAG: nucleotide exchange factor GrpE [Acidimicrobiales bacterium]